MTIAITFVPCFIPLLEGRIKPSVKLETAKRKPKHWEQKKKNEEIISSTCLTHLKRASSFMNRHEAARLHLLVMLSRYRRMSESVQHDKQWVSFKEYPNFASREKNEEIISSNSLPNHKRASSFLNKHKVARLHLLPKLLRYIGISECVQHDNQRPSLHDRWCLLCEVQCTSLHTEGLNQLRKWHNFWTIFSFCFTMQNRIGTNKAYHNLFYFNLSVFLVSSDLCFQTKCHLVQILLSLSEIWESRRQFHELQRACTKAMVPKVTTCNSSNSEVSITD